MTQKWIWQNKNWPNFDINSTSVLPHAMGATRAVAPLIKLTCELSPEKRAEFECQVTLDETISTSIIEKEVLDRDSVRSSISRHLGLPISKHGDRRYKSFTHVFFDSIRNASPPLTNKQIKAWHENLFIERPVFRSVTIGEYRDDEMSIVSGHFGRNESIHYQAPCSNQKCVKEQINSFLAWLNDSDNTDCQRQLKTDPFS